MASADYLFRMGKTHHICQDYAIAGGADKGVLRWAIVSDGCSGINVPSEPGSPYTDFGARFLTLSAKRNMASLANGLFRKEVVITEAAAMARQVGVPSAALDATLLAVAIGEGPFGHVFHHGDGVVAFREKNGDLRYTTWHFANNMPYYLSHTRVLEREWAYLDEAKTVEVVHGTRKGGVWTRHSIESEISALRSTFPFDSNQDDMVLLMSDGAESFKDSDGNEVPLEDILDQMFAIKSYPGAFLQRRYAFFQKMCAEKGWTHHDDFAVAGLYLGA